MEYKKRINLLDNTQNEPSKFRTRNYVEINDESGGTYKISIQIKFKTSKIRLNYVIIVMPTYLLVELKQLLDQKQMMLQNKQTK